MRTFFTVTTYVTIFLYAVLVAVAISALTGCTSNDKGMIVPSVPVVVEKPAPDASYVFPAHAWDNLEWSKTLAKSIDEQWDVLKLATDVPALCPQYSSLFEMDQKRAWGEIFVAVAYYESAWKTDTKYYEKTMGYNSEGLFQLSYVDEEWAKCGIDKVSKNLLDPHVNIKCAVKIMALQIKRTKEILLRKGMYWAVIREGGKYEKIDEIKKRVVSALPKCKAI